MSDEHNGTLEERCTAPPLQTGANTPTLHSPSDTLQPQLDLMPVIHSPRPANKTPEVTIQTSHSPTSSMNLLLAYGSSENDEESSKLPSSPPPLSPIEGAFSYVALNATAPVYSSQLSSALRPAGVDDSCRDALQTLASPEPLLDDRSNVDEIARGNRNEVDCCTDDYSIDSEEDSDSNTSSSSLAVNTSDGSESSMDQPPVENEQKISTRQEMCLDDLPPIQDFNRTISEQESRKMGSIYTVVNEQVVVESLPYIPALDFDTVLFIGHQRRALGRVFDVFGPVSQPYYVIRFYSAEYAARSGAVVGEDVFFFPSSKHYTRYVEMENLNCCGTDASGPDDKEIGDEEPSDDEEAHVHNCTLSRVSG